MTPDPAPTQHVLPPPHAYCLDLDLTTGSSLQLLSDRASGWVLVVALPRSGDGRRPPMGFPLLSLLSDKQRAPRRLLDFISLELALTHASDVLEVVVCQVSNSSTVTPFHLLLSPLYHRDPCPSSSNGTPGPIWDSSARRRYLATRVQHHPALLYRVQCTPARTASPPPFAPSSTV